jgi:hypothetical protein
MRVLTPVGDHSLPIQLYLVDTFTYSASALAAASVRSSAFRFMNERDLDVLFRCSALSLGLFFPFSEHKFMPSWAMAAGTRYSQDSPLSLAFHSQCGFTTTANVFAHAVR